MVKEKIGVIGMITSWFRGVYQYELIAGIEKEAGKTKTPVLYFSGKGIESPGDELHNLTYEDLSRFPLTGLIIPAVIADHATTAEVEQFTRKYDGIPHILLNFQIPGDRGLLINNRKGFSRLIYHLIEKHKYRKFAFFHGPPGHQDARERYTIFREILSRFDLPFNEKCLFFGDFSADSGARGMRTLLEKRNLIPGKDFEAIIASNDFMATGALKVLQEKKINVPGQVALTGFDDILEAACTIPPLTTVRQPIFDIGRMAVNDLLNGKKKWCTPETHLIVRNSCGCISTIKDLPEIVVLNNPNLSFASNLQINRGTLIEWVTAILAAGWPGRDPHEEAKNFIHFFLDFTIHKNREKFIKEFLILIRRGKKTELEVWHEVIALIDEYVNSHPCSVDLLRNIRKLLREAHIVITRYQKETEIRKGVITSNFASKLIEISDELKKAQDLVSLKTVLSGATASLGLNNFFLFLNKDIHTPGDQLFFLASHTREKEEISRSQMFEKIQPLAGSVCFLPLFFRNEQYGILGLPLNLDAWIAYEAFRTQLCLTLREIFLPEQNRDKEQKLNRLILKARENLDQAISDLDAGKKIRENLYGLRETILHLEKLIPKH